MKFIYIVIMLVLSSCSSINVNHVLNDFQIIAETTPARPPLSVRVLKVKDNGECSNTSCPKVTLYFAVSEFGINPKQTVYISPKKDDWEFIRWVKEAKFSESSPTVIMEIEHRENNKTTQEFVTLGLDEITYKKK